MVFPLGRPILLLAVIAVSGGVAAWCVRPAKRSDLELWTFAQAHADVYAPQTPAIERSLGQSVAIQLIPNNALNLRLVSLFSADRAGRDLPDVVEIRQDALGRFLGPPPDAIGFLPLDDFLADSHVKLLVSRLTPYTRAGHVFGLPHDVHPTSLCYRADLFAEAGIDLETPTPGLTYLAWPDFQQRCLRFQAYWRQRRAVPNRWALDLFSANAEQLNALLLQRGVNLIDEDGRGRRFVRLTDPLVEQTLLFYARLVAGPERIAADSVSAGLGVWSKDLQNGVVCGLIAPDWRVVDLKAAAPSLAGQWRMIPLPRFEAADAATTTWGGTMIAIPRRARDPAASWRLIENLYLGVPAVRRQIQTLDILPASQAALDQADLLSQPDSYFAGQAVRSLYARMAGEIPRQVLAPDTAYATAALGYVLSQTVADVAAGVDSHDLDQRTKQRLAARQADVEKQMAHGRLFEGGDAPAGRGS